MLGGKRTMLKKAALATVLLLTLLAAAAVGPAAAAELEAGQVWRYQTRAGEEPSRLYLVRVDRGPSGQAIYHIYLDGLKLRNPLMAGGVQDHLPHAPVSRESLEASVIELLGSDAEMPDISEGYAAWLLAFEKGRAGFFTMPVAQIVQHIEDAFSQAR
jgi:hypothetical protein